MVLAARDHGVLDVCQNPQGFFLKSLKFLQENWWRSDLACQTLEGIEAEAHLQRMCKKYRDAAMHEELSQLLDDHVKILEALCQQQGNDKRTADLIVSQLRSMFGGELLTPRPAYKAPLDANWKWGEEMAHKSGHLRIKSRPTKNTAGLKDQHSTRYRVRHLPNFVA